MVNYNRNSNHNNNNKHQQHEQNRTLHANNKENILDHDVSKKEEENNNSFKKGFNNTNKLNGFNSKDTAVNGNGGINVNHGCHFDTDVKSLLEEPLDEGATVLSACSRSPVVDTIPECPDEPVSSGNIGFADVTASPPDALLSALPKQAEQLNESKEVTAESTKEESLQNGDAVVLSQGYDVREHYAFFNRLFYDNTIMDKVQRIS